jgi:5-deoxy-glucuronate isomerase
MHPCHLTAHRSGFPLGLTQITREGEVHDCGVDFSILRMKAGERLEEASAKETAWVLLGGVAHVTLEARHKVRVARQSLFDERPAVVHLPGGAPVTIEAEGDAEWACVRTTNARAFAPRLFLPEDTSSEARGKGLVQDASLRIVRLTFDLEVRPESMLVIGEVVSLAGRWSSYPPHHHGQPELYHYRFTRPEGYGHAELGEEVLKVRSYDTVKILDGVDHPQVSAPGYGMYYLWIVRHQPGDPYVGFTYASDHRWILEGNDPGWAPRELK